VDVAKTPAAKEDKPKSKAPVLASTEGGLSAGQKLFLVGAIVALCALFLRSRGGKSSVGLSGKEKSMA
jgi:peptidyl-prolyl cis-trans isomerase B (cyclophilin B)